MSILALFLVLMISISTWRYLQIKDMQLNIRAAAWRWRQVVENRILEKHPKKKSEGSVSISTSYGFPHLVTVMKIHQGMRLEKSTLKIFFSLKWIKTENFMSDKQIRRLLRY